MTFKNPQYLYLLLLALPMIYLYIRREFTRKTAMRFSDLSVIKKLPRSHYRWLRHAVIFLRVAGFAFLVIALARPQKSSTEVEITTEGVDIMLVLDISESMRALDFRPDDRLAVAKRAISEFVKLREHDRMGLVLFAARAFTRVPLTNDHNLLLQMINEVDYMEFSNATAIGTAIATAANRLVDSPSQSRVIILLTDGASNAGDIPPQTAAAAAGELGIRVYAIGVGREGRVPFPVETIDRRTGRRTTRVEYVESDINLRELQEIAQLSGGKFFRAQDAAALSSIYNEIDEMEKTEIRSISYTSHTEHFYFWLWLGFAVLVLEMILAKTIFRRLP